jgi:hypothetical protein
MTPTRKCPQCGADVVLVYLMESGQRLLVNDGFVPVFTGTNSKGGVTFGRILHWQTCPGHAGIGISDQMVRATNDGTWKPKEADDDEGLNDTRKKGRRARR